MLVTETLEIGRALERQPSRQIALDHLIAGDEVQPHGRRHRAGPSGRGSGLHGGGRRRGRRCGSGGGAPQGYRRCRGRCRGCRCHRGRPHPGRRCRGCRSHRGGSGRRGGPGACPAGQARCRDPGGLPTGGGSGWRGGSAGRRRTGGGLGPTRGSVRVGRARGGELGGRRGQGGGLRDRHARRGTRLRVVRGGPGCATRGPRFRLRSRGGRCRGQDHWRGCSGRGRRRGWRRR